MPREQARAQAEKYAREVIDLVGAPVTPQGVRSNASPCSGTGYSILHIYNVEVAPEHQVEALTRVRDAWKERGYGILAFQVADVPGSPGGRLEGRTPGDGFGVKVMSTSPPSEITIWVGTPCFVDPTPVHQTPTATTPAATTPAATTPAVAAVQPTSVTAQQLLKIRSILG